MPYEIIPFETGYRVCKSDEPTKCFSNKPLSKRQATKQMKAIIISEQGSKEGAGVPAKASVELSSSFFEIRVATPTKEDGKRITIHITSKDGLELFLKHLEKSLTPLVAVDHAKRVLEVKPKKIFVSDVLTEDCDWFDMPTYEPNSELKNSPYFTIVYNSKWDKAEEFRASLGTAIKQKITSSTDSIWFPERINSLYEHNGWVYASDDILKTTPKYPIYVISKGRWEKRHTVKWLEWVGLDYKIVVEPQEYNDYNSVIDAKHILTLPEKYLNKNQGSIPARNFVMDHSKANGDKRHWILDDNIKSYKRWNKGERVIVKSGAAFRVVEDYTDRYSNVMLSGHHYSMFLTSINNNKPVFYNTRVYSSILINNDIPFEWRGRYNEDTDLSLRCLKAGFPTILFNAFVADKLATLSTKGGNTNSIYAEKDALLRKAQSLVDQHPDVAEVRTRFHRPHHYVDYTHFKDLKPKMKPDLHLTKDVDDYGLYLRNDQITPRKMTPNPSTPYPPYTNHIEGGAKKGDFVAQLKEVGLSPGLYLGIARKVAKREGYDPSALTVALDGVHKLTYKSPEGIKHFGRVGYGDYIIYCWLERNNEIPKGFADVKRNVFRKSHSRMSEIHKLGKYSPNELAINILW